jgi:hypothetical protein
MVSRRGIHEFGELGRGEYGYLNSFRFWFARFRGDSRKAHVLGEYPRRGSTTYDNFASKPLVRLAENMSPFASASHLTKGGAMVVLLGVSKDWF